MCHYGEGRKGKRENRRVERAGHLHTQRKNQINPVARSKCTTGFHALFKDKRTHNTSGEKGIINSLHQEGHASVSVCVCASVHVQGQQEDWWCLRLWWFAATMAAVQYCGGTWVCCERRWLSCQRQTAAALPFNALDSLQMYNLNQASPCQGESDGAIKPSGYFNTLLQSERF